MENKTVYEVEHIIDKLKYVELYFKDNYWYMGDLLDEVDLIVKYVRRYTRYDYRYSGTYYKDRKLIRLRLNRNKAVYEPDMDEYLGKPFEEVVVNGIGHEIYHHIERGIKDDSENRSHKECDKFGGLLYKKYLAVKDRLLEMKADGEMV